MDAQVKIIVDKLLEYRIMGSDLKHDEKAQKIEFELFDIIPEGEFNSLRNARSEFKRTGHSKDFIVVINNIIARYRNAGRNFKPTFL